MDKLIGIYKLTSPSGKVYIGQSVNIYKRFSGHKSTFNSWLKNKNIKSCTYLYSAFQKYGVDLFIYEIIEDCKKEELNIKEQYWLDFYKSYENDKGYNILQFARSNKGKIVLKETREKLSKIHRERIRSKESGLKISIALKGRIISDKQRKEVSIKLSNRTLSEETKNKMSLSKKGMPLSDLHKQRLSQSHKGKKLSKEHIKSMSNTLKGRKPANCKRVIDTITNAVYNDILEASNFLGLTYHKLYNMLSNRTINKTNLIFLK